MPPLKLALVVQRYGTDINGGAELHARYIAEHLRPYASVRVLTTCARDYITWRNELTPGSEIINDVPVERFPVTREREGRDFARRSRRVFEFDHSIRDELAWLESEGPCSPALVERVARSGDEFDFVLVFSVRYYHAYHTARAMFQRTVLVPTAERDPALGLAIFRSVFRGVRAIMYNSPEERSLIHAVADNAHVPGAVVGVGSEVPTNSSGDRAREKFGLVGPYVVYVGRIDANKGFPELFDHLRHYLRDGRPPVTLVLIGHAVVEIPPDPWIRHLGFVPDEDKFDVIAGSVALVMPSYFESLSMVALEAWALGRPVIANAWCDVLVGQCQRSGGGLYYQGVTEFSGVLEAVMSTPSLAASLGRQGREFYEAHYRWPIIERVYLDMFDRLAAEPARPMLESMPGWLAQRRPNNPPAADIVAALPSGPVHAVASADLQ